MSTEELQRMNVELYGPRRSAVFDKAPDKASVSVMGAIATWESAQNSAAYDSIRGSGLANS
jgi:hypothetical protein